MEKKQRKTRVTKKAIRKIREKKNTSIYKCKKTVIPGPWTNVTTELEVKAKIRKGTDILGNTILGIYSRDDDWDERGWYPIVFNIISTGNTKDVLKYGLKEYVAACEKYFNLEDNVKELGTIIILRVVVDHSIEEDRSTKDRFISVFAKTNKKFIKGFASHRGGEYKVYD